MSETVTTDDRIDACVVPARPTIGPDVENPSD
jgi:hypothetical protein